MKNKKALKKLRDEKTSLKIEFNEAKICVLQKRQEYFGLGSELSLTNFLIYLKRYSKLVWNREDSSFPDIKSYFKKCHSEDYKDRFHSIFYEKYKISEKESMSAIRLEGNLDLDLIFNLSYREFMSEKFIKDLFLIVKNLFFVRAIFIRVRFEDYIFPFSLTCANDKNGEITFAYNYYSQTEDVAISDLSIDELIKKMIKAKEMYNKEGELND